MQDKLQGFWDITKARLDERTEEVLAKDQEIESLQERHHVELKVQPGKTLRPCATSLAIFAESVPQSSSRL